MALGTRAPGFRNVLCGPMGRAFAGDSEGKQETRPRAVLRGLSGNVSSGRHFLQRPVDGRCSAAMDSSQRCASRCGVYPGKLESHAAARPIARGSIPCAPGPSDPRRANLESDVARRETTRRSVWLRIRNRGHSRSAWSHAPLRTAIGLSRQSGALASSIGQPCGRGTDHAASGGRSVQRQHRLEPRHSGPTATVHSRHGAAESRHIDYRAGSRVELPGQRHHVGQAQLSPPERPLATLLFLGPTGVGKTHCAKALAKYLFGDERRLLRFDMNEFSSADAVPHLAGSPQRPEGLLTNAIRRQPFQVLLLDEIEKAHPDVFDLLLQVLGEGRLTDANGRVADFTQAIVILTSNLGSAQSGRALGFDRSLADAQRVYTRAAEEFFRPEFFNRLDRIVPFQPLGRHETEQIARQLLQQVLQREGFLRRQCLATIDEAAIRQVAEAGFHPELGARALKRAIEREVVAPLAARLAAVHQATPVVITILASAAGLVSVVEVVESDALARAVKRVAMRPNEATRAARSALSRFVPWLARRRSDKAIVAGSLTAEQAMYFELKEQLDRLRTSRRAGKEIGGGSRTAASPAVSPRSGSPTISSLRPTTPGRRTRRGSGRSRLSG